MNNQESYKVNYDFLITNKTAVELRKKARELGESNVFWDKITKESLSKEGVVKLILDNPNYVFVTETEVKEYERDKKLKYYQTLPERIFPKCIKEVNINYEKPCLLFNLESDHRNGGGIRIYGKLEYAYRVSYALKSNIFVEDIPRINEDGAVLQVSHGHGCNPHCLEPSHLELKTVRENMYDDKIRDGTLLNGERCNISVITEEQAMDVIKSKGSGTGPERSLKTGVPVHIIHSIDNGYSWTHLSGIDNIKRRETDKKRRALKKEYVLTEEDMINAIKRLREKSVLSDEIDVHVSSHCWILKTKPDTNGYGIISFKGKQYRAHVLAYEAANGERDMTLPENKGNVVRHLCNNRKCCNPEHLRFGTASENMVDAYRNGHKQRKLSDDNVRLIRILIKSGFLRQLDISYMFGVHLSTINAININKSYKHVI